MTVDLPRGDVVAAAGQVQLPVGSSAATLETRRPGVISVANVDRLPGWQVKALADRYAGMVADTHLIVDNDRRALWRDIVRTLRAHPNHPRSP